MLKRKIRVISNYHLIGSHVVLIIAVELVLSVLVVSNFGRRTELYLDSLSEANLINVAVAGKRSVVVVVA